MNELLDGLDTSTAIKSFDPTTGIERYVFYINESYSSKSQLIIVISEEQVYSYTMQFDADAEWLESMNGQWDWESFQGTIGFYDLQGVFDHGIVVGQDKNVTGGRVEDLYCNVIDWYQVTYIQGEVDIEPMVIYVGTDISCHYFISETIYQGPLPGTTGLSLYTGQLSSESTLPNGPTPIFDSGYISCAEGYVKDESGACTLLNLNMDAQGYQQLTACEKELLRANPPAGITLQNNANLANAKTQELFGTYNVPVGNGHNDCGDAFRHAYFNALNTLSWSGSYAKQWGDAHECETPIDEALEKSMDLHNNAIGRSIAGQAPNISIEGLVGLILVELEVGNLNFLYPLVLLYEVKF